MGISEPAPQPGPEPTTTQDERPDGPPSFRCDIIRPEPNFENGVKGLSPYWAQEYTGADLLRQELLQNKTSLNPNDKLYEVFDTPEEGIHGELSSSLISSPYFSSPIPGPVRAFLPSEWTGNVTRNAQKLVREKRVPSFINSSMLWDSSATEEYSQLLQMTQPNATLLIASAENDYIPLSDDKSKAARDTNTLIVGSASYTGFPSAFSDYSPLIAISAPSNEQLLSYRKGKPAKYSGTSGATPEVTAALVAFELISGYHPSKEEAFQLLRRTATPTPFSYDKQSQYGAGMLNTYKIGKIAFRLKAVCGENSSCIHAALQKNSTFEFAKTDISQQRAMVASCPNEPSKTAATCDQKQEALEQIRGEALLNPDRADLWQELACNYRAQGFDQNANFYETLTNMGSEDKFNSYIRQRLAGEDPQQQGRVSDDVAYFVLKDSRWKDSSLRLLNNIIDQRLANIADLNLTDIELYPKALYAIFSSPAWADNPELLTKAIAKINPSDRSDFPYYLAMALGKDQWRSHPELVEQFMKKSPAMAFDIAKDTLSSPAWTGDVNLFQDLFQLNSSDIDFALAHFVLGNRGWEKHPELLKALIDRGDSNPAIAEYVLSQPAWSSHPEFLIALLKNADQETFSNIQNFVLTRPEWKNNPCFAPLLGKTFDRDIQGMDYSSPEC
jgi:hypothetical protein